MFAELDISVLPFPDNERMGADIAMNFELEKEFDPFAERISLDAQKSLAERYEKLFRLFLDNEGAISRGTFW